MIKKGTRFVEDVGEIQLSDEEITELRSQKGLYGLAQKEAAKLFDEKVEQYNAEREIQRKKAEEAAKISLQIRNEKIDALLKEKGIAEKLTDDEKRKYKGLAESKDFEAGIDSLDYGVPEHLKAVLDENTNILKARADEKTVKFIRYVTRNIKTILEKTLPEGEMSKLGSAKIRKGLEAKLLAEIITKATNIQGTWKGQHGSVSFRRD